MMRTLRLSAADVEMLRRGAIGARPLEYCAALLGSVCADAAIVIEVVRLANSDARPHRFTIADAELRRARACGAEARREIVALAHSHADARAVLSSHDRKALAYSRYPWVIIGFDEHGALEVAAFHAGSCEPIRVLIDDVARVSSSAHAAVDAPAPPPP